MKKTIVLVATLCCMAMAGYAQSKSSSVYYLKGGELQYAKQAFEKELNSNPTEANYYLGEIAYAQERFQEAKTHYEQSLAVNPEFALAQVGLGKIALKAGDRKTAESYFSSAERRNKKNAEVLVAIAEAYFLNGDLDTANNWIAKAVKGDKKSPLPYVLEGDILATQGDEKKGDALGKYEMAIYFDKSHLPAYLKSAQMYERINFETAIDRLNKVLEINPNYLLAHRDMGRIYTSSGYYPQAIEAYKLFFKGGNYSVSDLTRFASAYYFSKQYNEALPLLREGLEKEPDNFVLNRLYLYTLADLEQYAEALPVAEKLFAIEGDKNHKIFKDYMVYGDVLSHNERAKDALEQYKQAVELDSTKATVYKDISAALADAKEYADAAEFYKQYIEKSDSTEIESLDYFNLGRYYYYASSGIPNVEGEPLSEEKVHLLQEADQAFGSLAERRPDIHLGFLWRARTNGMLDPETTEGLAKPYYEQVVNLLEAKTDRTASETNDLIEGYRYLAYYSYLKEDKSACQEYCHKILAIDPENQVAKQLLEVFN